jgi:phosphonate transport system substrate-binding protein
LCKFYAVFPSDILIILSYRPVAKRRESLYAIFVVKEDSPYKNIRDLKGKNIAMAPKVAALSYLGKTALLEAGFDLKRDVTIKHVRGHHSCLQQVIIGNASACTTGLPALRVFEAKMKFNLKILGKTPSIPQMLFVVHSRISDQHREIIRKTLLNTTLKGVAPELKTLLMKNAHNPFISALNADYNMVRQYWKELETK